jgi:hypothetical protein
MQRSSLNFACRGRRQRVQRMPWLPLETNVRSTLVMYEKFSRYNDIISR